MDNFKFNNQILKQYHLKRLDEHEKTLMEKLQKLKNELQNIALTNELMFIKCTEFTEVVNNIFEVQKEIKKIENKEKEVKQNDKHINEK